MNIFAPNVVLPHFDHHEESVNVVLFELLRCLSVQGAEVTFCFVCRPGDDTDAALVARSREALSTVGVKWAEPLVLPELPQTPRNQVRRLLAPEIADFFPQVAFGKTLEQHFEPYLPDLLFLVWTEWLTAACHALPWRKFAYYGNPDPKNLRAVLGLKRAYQGMSAPAYALRLFRTRQMERAHLEIMRRYDFIGNVAALDADYYIRSGHPNAFYIQNVWIDRYPGDWRARRDELESDGNVLIGNIGRLTATANTYGLALFGEKILPALERRLSGMPYEIRLCGAGKLQPVVASGLARPRVINAGFVEDIDTEVLAAKGVMCFNNGTDYNVGHTRFLHVFSLGGCLIAHANARLAMPEIRHEENSLLGTEPDEIAELVARALADKPLRRRIGENAYATYKEWYTPEKVAASILATVAASR